MNTVALPASRQLPVSLLLIAIVIAVLATVITRYTGLPLRTVVVILAAGVLAAGFVLSFDQDRVAAGKATPSMLATGIAHLFRIVIGVAVLCFMAVAALWSPAARAAQPAHNPQSLLAAQREAMRPLAFMDGVWRGPATHVAPDGSKHAITQTERVGPFLDGAIRLVEGRGYDADGKVAFNAFGVVSFDPAKNAYNFRTHAMGRSGDFAFKPTTDGFTWEIPAGPRTIRYTTVIKDGTWHEVGDYIRADKPPARFFEMTLQRIGDSDWPGAIPAK